MRTFANLTELTSAVGQELGCSDWHEVTQRQIDRFADATGDHQWIHVDRERAAAGPFGATIAHGHLIFSLIPVLLNQVYRVEGTVMGINYGSNRVRFVSPLRAGSRIRVRATLLGVSGQPNGHHVTMASTVEGEGYERAVCVAETIGLYPT